MHFYLHRSLFARAVLCFVELCCLFALLPGCYAFLLAELSVMTSDAALFLFFFIVLLVTSRVALCRVVLCCVVFFFILRGMGKIKL